MLGCEWRDRATESCPLLCQQPTSPRPAEFDAKCHNETRLAVFDLIVETAHLSCPGETA